MEANKAVGMAMSRIVMRPMDDVAASVVHEFAAHVHGIAGMDRHGRG